MSVVSGHKTVLLEEAVDALLTDCAGTYVDATFGRGGHSALLLERMSSNGKLIGIDKDLQAVDAARNRFVADERFTMVHGSFADIGISLNGLGVGSVDGVLADLGVSSPQLDDPARGFSFQTDGPLDMRMNTSVGQSAAQWLKAVEESELVQVLRDYGEEKFAKRIARAVVESARSGQIETTLQLAKVVSDANPSWEKHKHPATRAFQAIRIKINNELGDLESFLEDSARLLKVGGRLVIISFHSLEDRIVKRFMRDKVKGPALPPGLPILEKDISKNYKLIGKAIKPTAKEVESNVRSRSAVMRVLEKIADE